MAPICQGADANLPSCLLMVALVTLNYLPIFAFCLLCFLWWQISVFFILEEKYHSITEQSYLCQWRISQVIFAEGIQQRTFKRKFNANKFGQWIYISNSFLITSKINLKVWFLVFGWQENCRSLFRTYLHHLEIKQKKSIQDRKLWSWHTCLIKILHWGNLTMPRILASIRDIVVNLLLPIWAMQFAQKREKLRLKLRGKLTRIGN